MSKIILTGGAGYIGSHIAVSLVEHGFHPVILDNFSTSDKKVIDALKTLTKNRLSAFETDCRDWKAVLKIMRSQGEITGVIHLAAYKAVGESVEEPLKYYDNNIGSLLGIASAMEMAQIKNFVFSSSCTVYGTPEEQPVFESTPWEKAFSPYGYTKQCCERIIEDLQIANPELNQVSLRYFNPIGAHPSALIGELPIGKPNNLVPFITQTAAGMRDELTIFGTDYNTPDGTCIRDYIHVMDLAEAHVAALKYMLNKRDSSLDIFNIGTGKGVSVKEIIEIFEEVNGVKVPYKNGARRPGDVESIYANVDKATEVLKWKAEYPVSEALEHAWKWQKQL